MEIFDYRAESASLRVVSSSAMMRPGEQSVIAYSGLPMATLLAGNLVSLLLVRPHHNYIHATIIMEVNLYTCTRLLNFKL